MTTYVTPEHTARPVLHPFLLQLRGVAYPLDTATLVYAHYVIERSGVVLQLVPDERRLENSLLGNIVLGIHFVNENPRRLPYTSPQIDSGIALCIRLIALYTLSIDHIIRVGRDDPGSLFPFDWFIAQLAPASLATLSTITVTEPTTIYQYPTNQAPVVGRLQAGDTVSILDPLTQWLRVRNGYIKRPEKEGTSNG